eukprot:m.79605 g.79605  ORF g.79605 m.79605 type:complete len:60 (+) comp8009_c0_seq1:128-307(+)
MPSNGSTVGACPDASATWWRALLLDAGEPLFEGYPPGGLFLAVLTAASYYSTKDTELPC